MSRLTPPTDGRAWSEAAFQRHVVDLARDLGWGITQTAAKTMRAEAEQYGVAAPPIDGLIYHPRYSLGSEPGWPDLTLVRRRDRRLIFAELKAEKGRLSARQAEVLNLLGSLMVERPEIPDDFPITRQTSYLGGVVAGLDMALRNGPRIEVFVWRPSDLPAIAEVLR